MSGSSVDTVPFGSAVRNLQTISRGSYLGPAIGEQSLQASLGTIDGLDPGTLASHAQAAAGSTDVGQLRGGLLPMLLSLLGQAATGAIGGMIGDAASDWFGRRAESAELADGAAKAADMVDTVVEESDSAINAILDRAVRVLDLLLKYLGTIDPVEHPEEFMQAVRWASEIIDSAAAMVSGTCGERDAAIGQCYDQLLDKGSEICEQPCPELPPEVIECETEAPPVDSPPTSPAMNPPPGEEKKPTPGPGPEPVPESEPKPAPAPEDCPPGKKPVSELAPEPEPQPEPEDCPPEEEPVPKPESDPGPKPGPAPEDCPPEEKLEPPAGPAPEPNPTPDLETTPATNSPPPAPVPEPGPVPEPVEEVPEPGATPEPEPEPMGEKTPTDCCSGVLGLLGVGVAILAVGLLVECLEDLELPPVETPEPEPEPEPEPGPEPEPAPDLSQVPEPEPPPKKLLHTEPMHLEPSPPAPVPEPGPPAPAPPPVAEPAPAPIPAAPPAAEPAPAPESEPVGVARKAGAW